MKSHELVVILHGIGMPKMRMSLINYCLRREGYATLNIGYPSLRKNIESCAEFVAQEIEKFAPEGIEKIHFVCHSMGSLVALNLLATRQFASAQRAVFIAPPYRGSEVADFLHNMAFYKFLFGPAGAQLTTAYRTGVTYELPHDLEIGVIAGTLPLEHPWFLPVMKKTGVHDGLVSLESTRIPGIRDHITLRLSHSLLLEKSASYAVHFLEHGRFMREDG